MEAKVAAFALDDDTVTSDSNGIVYHGQTSRQNVELLVGENEGF